jgi:hypothetical protein
MSRKIKKTLYLTVLLALVLAGTFLVSRFVGQTLPGVVKTESTVEPREGLILYLNMDDESINGTAIFDKSGSGNNGTINSVTTGVTGRINQAFDFPGAADTVTIDASFDPPAAGTVSFWAKSNGAPSVRERHFGIEDAWETRFETDGTIYFDLGIAGSQTTFRTQTAAITGTKWYHLVAAYDSVGNTYEVFIDGVSNKSGSATISDIGAGTLTIGLRTGNAEDFNGTIDEFRVYNRKLSTAEVAQLYNASKRAEIVNAPPREGLVGYWNMDDESVNGATVFDKSGHGNDGTKQGATGANNTPQSATGKINQALDFDGTDDYLDIADNAVLNITTNITVAGWIKLDILDTYQKVYSSGTQSNAWEFGISNTNEITFTELFIADNLSDTSLSADLWYHVAFVKSGDSGANIAFYLNGVADGTASVGSVSTPSGSKKIGRRGDISSDYINGRIDEVRVYNRALSAAEITALYNYRPATVSTSQNSKNANGLVGLWSFNGQDMDWASTTAEALDRSGQGNNGDVTNFGQGSVRPGKVGQALSFDGVDDVIKAPSGALNLTSSITFSAWFKPDGTNGNNGRVLAWDSGSTRPYEIEVDEAGTENLSCFVNSSSDTGTVTVTGTVNDRWYHMVCVYDSVGGTFTMYLDGVAQTPDTASGSITYSGFGEQRLLIGDDPDQNNFSGLIDEVRVYNRALSAVEVLELYQGR